MKQNKNFFCTKKTINKIWYHLYGGIIVLKNDSQFLNDVEKITMCLSVSLFSLDEIIFSIFSSLYIEVVGVIPHCLKTDIVIFFH